MKSQNQLIWIFAAGSIAIGLAAFAIGRFSEPRICALPAPAPWTAEDVAATGRPGPVMECARGMAKSGLDAQTALGLCIRVEEDQMHRAAHLQVQKTRQAGERQEALQDLNEIQEELQKRLATR